MNKVEIFKKHLWQLINNRQFNKAKEFKQFLYNYFLRKGQKTEYVYCLSPSINTIEQITDKMLDSIA